MDANAHLGVNERMQKQLQLMLLSRTGAKACDRTGELFSLILRGPLQGNGLRVLVAQDEQAPSQQPFDTLVLLPVEDEHAGRNLAQTLAAQLRGVSVGGDNDDEQAVHALLLRSRWPKPPAVGHAPQHTGAGVVMVSAMHRAADITHEQFDHHWRERHAPLALRHHPGMAAYQQNVVEQVLTQNTPAWDGVAVLYFDSPDDLANRLYNDEEGQRVIMQDVARFVDLERSSTVLMADASTTQVPEPGSLERSSGVEKHASLRESLRNPEALLATIDRLETEGGITPERATALRSGLAETLRDSVYVVGHLGAHLGIGAIRVWMPLLPIGSIARSLWVLGSRVVETLRGRYERARVHSATVFFVALIPFLGYCSYLVALRRVSEDAAFLYANHVSYGLSGESFEVVLEGKPAWVQRMAKKWMVD